MTYAVVQALLPIVMLIALGAILRRRQFVSDAFWREAERLGYFVLLPCLFFHSLATAHLEDLPVGGLALTLVSSTVIVATMVLVARPLMNISGAAFTSVFQGSIRFNNYVGVTLTAGLFGAKGIALAAICNAAIVPTVNILCVMAFVFYGTARLSRKAVFRQLVSNPLVIGSVGGIAFQALGLGVPMGLGAAMQTLGAASLPIGLLCIGAALDFASARDWLGPVISSSLIKFAAMPVVTMLMAHLVGLSGPSITTALLFQTLPTASSAYILARQLGGDAPLMAGITAMQTALALFIVPLVLIAVAASGLL